MLISFKPTFIIKRQWWKAQTHYIETTHQQGLARKLMAYGCYIVANSWFSIYKYNHVYYVEIFGNLKGGCITIVTKMKIPRWSQCMPWFIRNLRHEMVDNKMHCVVRIVWHSKYELREDLTQLHMWVNSL